MSFQTTIISIIVMILIGVLLKKLNILKTEDNETLNKIVVNIGLPCMIFNALYTANVSLLPDLSILTVFILLCSLIVGIITYLILKVLAYDNKALWSTLVVVVLGNTGFLGYPISQGIFGAEGLVRAAFCDLATSIIFIAVSIILIIIFDGSIKTAIKKIVTFMPLWGIILGILLNVFSIPIGDFGTTIVNYLGGSTVPLIMISLGLSLNLRGFRRHLKEVSLASIIKLIIYPLVGIGVLSIFGIVGLEYKIGLLEAMMPSAMLALILSLQFNLDSDLTSDCIFTDTLLSLITIPIFLFIFITLISIDCFAQTVRYRYLMVSDEAISIVDVKEKLPNSKLSMYLLSLNTEREQNYAINMLNNVKSYYYAGQMNLYYMDNTLSKTKMHYIGSWRELISYVRGEE